MFLKERENLNLLKLGLAFGLVCFDLFCLQERGRGATPVLGLPCTTEDPDERRKADSENRHTHDDEVYSLELLLHVNFQSTS